MALTNTPTPQTRRAHVPGGLEIYGWLNGLGFTNVSVIFRYYASNDLSKLLRSGVGPRTYPAATGTVRFDTPQPLQGYDVQAWSLTATVTAHPTQGAQRESRVQFLVTEVAIGSQRLTVYEQLIAEYTVRSSRRTQVNDVFTPVIA